jgi:hypothetical protein
MKEPGYIELLRAQRHSFLNHLQVIAGRLQLAQAEQAAGYLAEVTARMRAEGESLSRLDGEAFSAFLSAFLQAELYAVKMTVRVAEPPPPEAGGRLQAVLQAAVAAASGLPAERRRLDLRLEGSRLTIRFPGAVALPFTELVASVHELTLAGEQRQTTDR